MADETHVIRGINWRETFPFTQIFRAFRVAIHPSKLALAVAALLCIYVGGRVLDALWPVQHRALPGKVRADAAGPNEVEAYEAYRRGAQDKPFADLRKDQREALERWYAGVLAGYEIEKNADKARDEARGGNLVGKVEEAILKKRDKSLESLKKDYDETLKAADDELKRATEGAPADKKAEEKRKHDDRVKESEKAYKAAVIRAYDNAAKEITGAQSIKGEGIFIQFFSYEVQQVNNVAWAVMANEWLAGIGPNRAGARPGVFASIYNFFVVGPWWMARFHTWFFVLFAILFSVVWAVFGGAIARIAAVHVARDEKVSLSSAVRFSTGKFLSFIFAPVIPLLIVLVVGLIVMVGGFVGNIPWVGPFLMGLFFFLALAAGFVMTLVLLGTVGGYNLMYPTIAVEGSDSFDAISRSFSYVYARPWRMIFYTLVAVVYGAICFLFVRFFLVLMLSLTHHFVDSGMFVSAKPPTEAWNIMWPAPDSDRLPYAIESSKLTGGQNVGAHLVMIWVYLATAMLGAFAISFYFSANTIIYFLMRREVDATELDDVYLEQSEDDFTADATAPVATSAPAATETPAAPPATEPPPAGNA